MHKWRWIAGGLCLLVLVGVGWSTADRWQPWLTSVLERPANAAMAGQDDHGHDHGAGSATGVVLTAAARENLGLQVGEVALTDYVRTVTFPGEVTEQTGHCDRRITTPIAGIVTRVHALPGQAVRPGDPLLDLMLRDDAVTTAQTELLKIVQLMELNDLELQRLSPLAESGSIASKTKLEKEYERKRLQSLQHAQTQELLVRGFTAEQIAEVIAKKTLLRDFTLYVPEPLPHPGHHSDLKPVTPGAVVPVSKTEPDDDHFDDVSSVESLATTPGKLAKPGDELLNLGRHIEIYLEGHAFERDAAVVDRAVRDQSPITALFEGDPDGRTGLMIRYVENAIDADTRTFRFFIPLTNEIVRDTIADNGRVYRTWRFRPGQKLRLLVPVERLTEQVVLPAEAVVFEGPDAYVFRANGDRLDRVAVVVLQRDPRQIVIAKNRGLYLGDRIALNQAYQLNLALKKQQGGGTDLHAGHNH